MENNQFYAMLSRMKYVNRWGTMRNTSNENICEHSLNVAFIAHALGIINNEEFNGNIDAQRLAVLGMYHDVTEIITGDLPTPVKYYSPMLRRLTNYLHLSSVLRKNRWVTVILPMQNLR